MGMLEDALRYPAALEAYAKYEGAVPERVEDCLRADMRAAGFGRVTPAALLERCYRKAVGNED